MTYFDDVYYIKEISDLRSGYLNSLSVGDCILFKSRSERSLIHNSTIRDENGAIITTHNVKQSRGGTILTAMLALSECAEKGIIDITIVELRTTDLGGTRAVVKVLIKDKQALEKFLGYAKAEQYKRTLEEIFFQAWEMIPTVSKNTQSQDVYAQLEALYK